MTCNPTADHQIKKIKPYLTRNDGRLISIICIIQHTYIYINGYRTECIGTLEFDIDDLYEMLRTILNHKYI